MFDRFERTVAFRYLRARRKEGFISVITLFSLLGIMLGVATLIIVMSVMNGFRAELVGRVLGLGGHIDVYGTEGPITEFDDLAARISVIDGVVSVTPTIRGQALVSHRGIADGAKIRGVPVDDFMARPSLTENLRPLPPEDFSGTSVVAIGAGMAARFGIVPGDSITMIAPEGNVTALQSPPTMRSFRVAAVFEVGMHEYDNQYVYMPLEAARAFLPIDEGVTALEVILRDGNDLDTAQDAVAAALNGAGRLETWQDANATLFGALQVERTVMFLILTLIIVVAAFNIVSGMVMLVKAKGRDIAILRTMGATQASVMRVFLLTGASIGIVGTLIGLGLGVGFAGNIDKIRQWIEAALQWIRSELGISFQLPPVIQFLSQIPASIDWTEVASIVALSIGLSFAATLYPSWRAARLDPVEALRYE